MVFIEGLKLAIAMILFSLIMNVILRILAKVFNFLFPGFEKFIRKMISKFTICE